MSPVSAFEVGLIVSHTRGAFVDDANTLPLDAFTRIDAHASYRLRPVSVFVESRNLLDRKFNTSGFVDPAGTGEVYYYPAAGRVVSAGIRRGW
jgi:outer membrane receptor protein involved in Fe transport